MSVGERSKDDGLVDGLAGRIEALAIGGEEEESPQVCPVCKETCVNPVRLPCAHVFCYLCVKGVAARGGRCAMCRRPIPPSTLHTPHLLDQEALRGALDGAEGPGRCEWFYEARGGGWWMYESRTSRDIESAFQLGRKTAKVQVAGFSYVIDFDTMVQYREDIPTRRRKIKRDEVKGAKVKGIAGAWLKQESPDLSESTKQ